MNKKTSIFQTDLYICARKYKVIDKKNRTLFPQLDIHFMTEDGFFAAAHPSGIEKSNLQELEGKQIHELPYENEAVFPAGQIERVTDYGIYGRISKDCILRAREYYQMIFRARSERWITAEHANLWSYFKGHNSQVISHGVVTQTPQKHHFLFQLNKQRYSAPSSGIVVQGMNIIGIAQAEMDESKLQYSCLSAAVLLRELCQFKADITQAIAEGHIQEEPDPEFIIHKGVLEKYLGNADTAMIPEGVHTIGERAFEFSDVQSIIFPNGLKKIGLRAFDACIYLREVSFPDSLTEIGNSAFSLCRSLKRLDLPKSIKKIGSHAFSSCENLLEVSLPDGLKVIEESLFECCQNIRSLVVPTSVVQIDSYAFASCEKLSSISVSLKTKIGTNPFLGTPWLQKYLEHHGSLIMGGTLVSVNDKLTEFKIPASVRRIGTFAFLKSNIEKLHIPNHVKVIEAYAFSDSHIKSIRLPQNLSRIEKHTFSNCLELEELTIPQSVTSIGSSALYNLPNCVVTILNSEETDTDIYTCAFTWADKNACIKELRAPYGSKAMQCAMELGLPYTAMPGEPADFSYLQGVFCCSGTVLVKYLGHDKIVHIPDGITEIADYAFKEGYSGCEEIHLPDSLKIIGCGAFIRCNTLRRIVGPGVEMIHHSAFFSAEQLEYAEFPKLKIYVNDAFFRCPSLDKENLHIPRDAKAINKY